MRIALSNLLGILCTAIITQVALAQPISVSLPSNATGVPGSTVDIPIKVNDLTGQNILAFQATLTFDLAVLTPIALTTIGTISDSLDTVSNSQPGRMIFGAYGIHPLAGSDTLIAVRFQVNPLAKPGDTTALVLERFIFNSNFPAVKVSNGMFSVAGLFPQIQVFSNTCDYGEVVLGTSVLKAIRIGNRGLASLVVDQTMLRGPDAGVFHVQYGGAPFVMAVSDSHDLEIRFAPTTLGTKTAVLEIASNDPEHHHVEVQLRGTATLLAEQQTELTYAFPNPFDPRENPIKIFLGKDYTQSATVTINDGRGNPLRILSHRLVNSNGADFVTFWDGRDQRGDFVPNGVYFYVIDNGHDRRLIGKIVVLR